MNLDLLGTVTNLLPITCYNTVLVYLYLMIPTTSSASCFAAKVPAWPLPLSLSSWTPVDSLSDYCPMLVLGSTRAVLNDQCIYDVLTYDMLNL